MMFANRIEKPLALVSRTNRLQRARDWVHQKTLPANLMLAAAFSVWGCASQPITAQLAEQKWPPVAQTALALHSVQFADNKLRLSFDSTTDSRAIVRIGDSTVKFNLREGAKVIVSVPDPCQPGRTERYMVDVTQYTQTGTLRAGQLFVTQTSSPGLLFFHVHQKD